MILFLFLCGSINFLIDFIFMLKVLTFGCNDEGVLGRDTSKEGIETIPGEVKLDVKAVQISAGDSHSAALLEDGHVFAWGAFRVR